MFHQGMPSFRAWLGAFARELPRAPRRLRDEIDRLGDRLGESERDRAERLALIHRLQAESAERAEAVHRLTTAHEELRAYAARLETARDEREAESAERGAAAARLAADRQELLAYVVRLEATLGDERRERERWLAVLPSVRLRLPGGRATAERLRALRRRLRGGGPARQEDAR